jgi:hypothetical protein
MVYVIEQASIAFDELVVKVLEKVATLTEALNAKYIRRRDTPTEVRACQQKKL